MKEQRTKVAIVVDESGSMQSFSKDVVEQTNIQIGLVPRKDTVAIFKFNTTVVGPYSEFPGYHPSGGTALWDAVDQAILHVDDGKTPALVIVLTDGEENSSRKTSSWALSQKINALQRSDRFTFAFMVPTGYKNRLVYNLGVHPGNVTEWEQTQEDYRRVSHDTMMATTSYFSERAAGKTATASFYTDLSTVKPQDVVSSLTNIEPDCKVLAEVLTSEI